MKLELNDLFDMGRLVSPFPEDLALPLLKNMTNDFDEITYQREMGYEEICEALRWLGSLSKAGKRFGIKGEDARKIAYSFNDEDKKLVIGEWLIRSTRIL